MLHKGTVDKARGDVLFLFRIILKILLIIMGTEFIIMHFIMSKLPLQNSILIHIFDALLLGALCVPLLHIWVYKDVKFMYQSSSKDSLTGLSNRRHFDEHLHQEWQRAMRNSSPISLLLVDVDFFKEYNDTFGHLKGDDSLKQIANTIQSQIKRPYDLVARYGGEEFAVILPETNMQGAQSIAESIRAEVIKMNINHPRSNKGYLTVSLGLSTLIPHPRLNINQFINDADNALYKAKKNGRNQLSVSQFESP